MIDAPDIARTRASDASELARLAKAHAYAIGFDLVGIAALGPAETSPEFEAWLREGRAGTMAYLERGAEKRRDTRLPLPGTTHAIVVALDYGGKEPSGPVARYARGDDYHDVMDAMLRELHRRVASDAGREVLGKPYVDTGPLLERDLARRAGLGWFGKNTNLINPTRGSFVFLGALVVDVELTTDEPFEADRCGTCTRCIEACPTQAITAPRELDARRCISYLTIELREEIPVELREGIGDRIYGCDVCQDVCPWNVRFARELPEKSPFRPRAALPDRDARALARDLLAMTQEEFARVFKGSPMKRAKLRGLKRNAAVVLGNVGSPEDVPALLAALSDEEPLAPSQAAWTLGRLGLPASAAALRDCFEVEPDDGVRAELGSALDARAPSGR
ncbi:MAG TPA: tRNA epoxyqueuosine(34) reductase QueG [Gemmatimonadaceae bacterium]|nr:tRNA epoxyqueuosine(34) reductase QueG [Gemmatimonadaceae bacterium]